jgi:hypothetical protein
MNGYAHPQVLFETHGVKSNLGKSGIKLVEIDVDVKAYDAGHIRGAVGFNWQTDLQAQVGRDIIGKEAFEKLAHVALVSMVSGALVGGLYAGLVGTVHLVVYGRWDHIPAFTLGCVLAGAVLGLLGRTAWSLSSEDAPERMDRRSRAMVGRGARLQR